MDYKVGIILSGILLIIGGISIIVNPAFYHQIYQFYFDYRGYNIPLGIFMIGVGVLLLWTTLRKNKPKT